ncbi:MAG TPA: diguanylate cyclase [Syntrophales bacterium]|nr:diguanylate cyclase [Syntrophales bacterium]
METYPAEKIVHLIEKWIGSAHRHGVFLKDNKLRYVWANEAFLHDVGMKNLDDLKGKTDRDMPWPDLAYSIEEQEKQLFTGQINFLDDEETRAKKDGGKLIAKIRRRPIFNSDGETIGLMGFYFRYPDRSEEDNPFFLESFPLPTSIFDLKENVLSGNRPFIETVGALKKKEKYQFFSFLKSLDDTKDQLSGISVCLGEREYVCFSNTFTDYKIATLVDFTEQARTNNELTKANEWLKAWIWELEYHNRKLEIIHQMGCALQLCRSVADAGTVIKKHLPRLIEAAGGTLFLPDETRQRLPILVSFGDNSNLKKSMPAEDCIAFRYGRLLSPQENTCYRCLSSSENRNFSCLCLPMMVSGRPEGVLSLRLEPTEVSESIEKELLTIATEYISLAIGNLQLQDQLMLQATRDPLTNLFNRRYMEESLNREFFRCQRKGLPISLILIDIDFFKLVNDRYGHDAGDFVLKTFAGYLLKSIRKEDIACRYGGEEFVVILPETPLEAAMVRAEHLRKNVMISSIEYRGEIITDITVSMGIATWPLHGEDPISCLKAADLALYRAKEEGRNRVVVANAEHVENNGKSYLNIENNPSLLNRH